MQDRKIVGISAAAQRLGVHINTLRKWADDGTVPVLRMPSGHRRFEVAELERFKQAMATAPRDRRQKAPDRDKSRPGE